LKIKVSFFKMMMTDSDPSAPPSNFTDDAPSAPSLMQVEGDNKHDCDDEEDEQIEGLPWWQTKTKPTTASVESKSTHGTDVKPLQKKSKKIPPKGRADASAYAAPCGITADQSITIQFDYMIFLAFLARSTKSLFWMIGQFFVYISSLNSVNSVKSVKSVKSATLPIVNPSGYVPSADRLLSERSEPLTHAQVEAVKSLYADPVIQRLRANAQYA